MMLDKTFCSSCSKH